MHPENYKFPHYTIKRLMLLILIITYCQPIIAQNITHSWYTPPISSIKILDDSIMCYTNLRYGPIPDSAKTANSDRIFDLYLPAKTIRGNKLPLFLFIHGGGFSGGDKSLKMFCVAVAKNGCAVVSINYRLTMKYHTAPGASCASNMSKGLPVDGKFHPLLEKAVSNASDDAAMALRYLSLEANKYHLDMQNIVLCGGSAGAMTALNLAYISKAKRPPIKAVVDLWGGLENSDLIPPDAPPVLTLHGDKDEVINIAYAFALQRKMQEIGSKKSSLIILKGIGHAQYQYVTDHKIGDIISFIKLVTE